MLMLAPNFDFLSFMTLMTRNNIIHDSPATVRSIPERQSRSVALDPIQRGEGEIDNFCPLDFCHILGVEPLPFQHLTSCWCKVNAFQVR